MRNSRARRPVVCPESHRFLDARSGHPAELSRHAHPVGDHGRARDNGTLEACGSGLTLKNRRIEAEKRVTMGASAGTLPFPPLLFESIFPRISMRRSAAIAVLMSFMLGSTLIVHPYTVQLADPSGELQIKWVKRR